MTAFDIDPTAEEVAMSPDGPPTRRALGRGLAALIPSATGESPSPQGGSSQGLKLLPIERVRPNPGQPRKTFDDAALLELAASIKEDGILQPIVVRRDGEYYEIVAGERRWRAAAKAGVHEVPVIVKDLADEDALRVAIVENIQRQDLDPLEEADAYRRLIRDFGHTQDEVAAAVGKSRSAIANSMRLLRLPTKVLDLLSAGELTAGHARAIMTLSDKPTMERFADEVIKQRMSVRDAEQRARKMKSSAAKVKAMKRTPEEIALESKLEQGLRTKVRLHHRKGAGRLEIHFHSLEELDTLTEKLLGH